MSELQVSYRMESQEPDRAPRWDLMGGSAPTSDEQAARWVAESNQNKRGIKFRAIRITETVLATPPPPGVAAGAGGGESVRCPGCGRASCRNKRLECGGES